MAVVARDSNHESGLQSDEQTLLSHALARTGAGSLDRSLVITKILNLA